MNSHVLNEIKKVTCGNDKEYEVDKIYINGIELNDAQIIFNGNTKTLYVEFDTETNHVIPDSQTTI